MVGFSIVAAWMAFATAAALIGKRTGSCALMALGAAMMLAVAGVDGFAY